MLSSATGVEIINDALQNLSKSFEPVVEKQK
jgi:hypothetical protein